MLSSRVLFSGSESHWSSHFHFCRQLLVSTDWLPEAAALWEPRVSLNAGHRKPAAQYLHMCHRPADWNHEQNTALSHGSRLSVTCQSTRHTDCGVWHLVQSVESVWNTEDDGTFSSYLMALSFSWHWLHINLNSYLEEQIFRRAVKCIENMIRGV